MERRVRLAARISNLREFRDLVRAMRAIAGSHVQEARDFLPGIRSYSDQIENGVVNAIRLCPEAPEKPSGEKKTNNLVLAICSEHGLSGAYSDRILDKAMAVLAPQMRLGIIGRRGRLLAEERGLQIDWSAAMATHTTSVSSLCAEMMEQIANFTEVSVIFARYLLGGRFEVCQQKLLPLDPQIFEGRAVGVLPIHNLQAGLLLNELTLEYVYSQLMHAIMEAFASENGARLQLMEAADQNIQEKLQVLARHERTMRQEEVTSELLDIVVGAEAVRQHS